MCTISEAAPTKTCEPHISNLEESALGSNCSTTSESTNGRRTVTNSNSTRCKFRETGPESPPPPGGGGGHGPIFREETPSKWKNYKYLCQLAWQVAKPLAPNLHSTRGEVFSALLTILLTARHRCRCLS